MTTKTATKRTTKSTGERIAEARERIGWSRARLADAAGVTERSIERIEAGDRLPSVTVFALISRALRMPMHHLLSPSDCVPRRRRRAS